MVWAELWALFVPTACSWVSHSTFASLKDLGGLNIFDSLDNSIIAWWGDIIKKLYQRIPDMAGYLVKANSEGQPGPMKYNHSLAQGVNLFARAIQPYRGIVMFHAFVYDSQHLNKSVWTEDQANAAVQYFGPLDGQFDDNMVIQIKYSLIDFQVHKPASPLFSNLTESNTAIKLEITQEYLGQQCHLVYLPPLWKTILDFDLHAEQQPSLVSDIVSGKRFGRCLGGYAGVANVGSNTTWEAIWPCRIYMPTGVWRGIQRATRRPFCRTGSGSHLGSTARLWTQSQTCRWSCGTHENYSGNLGIQTLTDILYLHYGPNPASQDNNPWGQWTRADKTTLYKDSYSLLAMEPIVRYLNE